MKKYLILARFNDPVINYLVEHVLILANNWDEAYKKVKDAGYTPFVDEYEPIPNKF